MGLKTVLVERYAALGGVCLNVARIPPNELLHPAALLDAVSALAPHGITFRPPQLDL